MKKTLLTIGLIGAGLYLWNKYRQVQAAKNFIVTPVGVSLGQFSFPFLNIGIKFKVTNYSNVSVTAQQIFGSLKKDATTIGSFSSNGNIIIPGNSTKEIAMDATVNMVTTATSLFSMVTSLFSTGLQAVKGLYLDCVVVVDGVDVPLQYSLT